MRSNCGVLVTFVLFCIGASFVASQHPLAVTGAGASFPAEVYKSWASSFVAERPDLQIIYNSTGSGNGLRTITEGTLPFSASDAVPSDSSYDQVPDLQVCYLFPLYYHHTTLLHSTPHFSFIYNIHES